jgi:hypothetical protein
MAGPDPGGQASDIPRPADTKKEEETNVQKSNGYMPGTRDCVGKS